MTQRKSFTELVHELEDNGAEEREQDLAKLSHLVDRDNILRADGSLN